MLAVIGLAFGYRSRSSHQGFLIFASVALALMAARRLNNALVAWTDLMDLVTYAWLASVMWVPVVAAWSWPGTAGASLRGEASMWRPVCWRRRTHRRRTSAGVTSGSRLGRSWCSS